MRIQREWFRCDDGITRPMLSVTLQAADGSPVRDLFLIDSGADRTVLSAQLLAGLRTTHARPEPGQQLAGIGGQQAYVLVQTSLQFNRDDGVPILLRGEFAAFTDPAATDLSILGRDVLNLFDVILSRPRSQILLLAAPHTYRVEASEER